MAGPPSRTFDILDQSVNEVLVHVGKVLRAQGKNGRKTVSALSAAKINESNVTFNTTLDNFEVDILRAKAILRRDLELVRAKKSTAASVSAAAAAKQEKQETPVPALVASVPASAPAQAPPFMNQAPPAAMDIDSEETAPAPAIVTPKIKSEFGPNQGAGANAANVNTTKPSMAPVPNMDIDMPTPVPVATPVQAPAPPSSAPMSASGSNRSQGKQPANGKSPAVKKELSRSPQLTTKPAPVPGARNASTAGLNGVSKATAAVKKANSPAATRVPSPAASRSTASPATSKAPSPVLVKSVASPANKAFGSQPPTPTLNKATTGGLSKTVSQSSSASPSVATTSPVLTKKAAAAKAVSKSTTPVPVPRIPTPATAPVAPPPAVPPAAAPVPKMEANMDNFFDLTSPSASNEPTNMDQGFTNMQFSLVPIGTGESKQQQQQQQQQKKQQPMKPPQPQQSSMDDFEFDVEKFATDAAQNLLTDNSYATAPGGSANASQAQPQAQAPAPQTTVPAPADTAMGGAGSIDDDLFKFIDDNMEGLGDDATTNFDELFMDNMDTTDSVDLDSFFDA